jgi:hypothetical protein
MQILPACMMRLFRSLFSLVWARRAAANCAVLFSFLSVVVLLAALVEIAVTGGLGQEGRCQGKMHG